MRRERQHRTGLNSWTTSRRWNAVERLLLRALRLREVELWQRALRPALPQRLVRELQLRGEQRNTETIGDDRETSRMCGLQTI